MLTGSIAQMEIYARRHKLVLTAKASEQFHQTQDVLASVFKFSVIGTNEMGILCLEILYGSNILTRATGFMAPQNQQEQHKPVQILAQTGTTEAAAEKDL